MEARFLYCFLKKALNLSTNNPYEASALEIFVIYCLKKFDSKCSFFKGTILEQNSLYITWSTFKGENKQCLKAQFLSFSYFRYKQLERKF